jgi:hypothetical protein
MAGQSCPGIINCRSFGKGGIESERSSSLLFEGGCWSNGGSDR